MRASEELDGENRRRFRKAALTSAVFDAALVFYLAGGFVFEYTSVDTIYLVAGAMAAGSAVIWYAQFFRHYSSDDG